MKKKLFYCMAVILCCLTSMTAKAQDGEELINTVINVTTPGTLEEIAPVELWEDKVGSLKITGSINGYDLRFVRRFCGSDEYGGFYRTNLKTIDLSEAVIVPGGSYYIHIEDKGTPRDYNVLEDAPNLLPDKLFYNCFTIEKIILPNNIREIGIGCFFTCTSLKEVVMPDDITRINSTAFGVCVALESITLPSKLEHLGGYAFTHCRAIDNITIPEGVKHLHMRLFEQTNKLRTLHLPSHVTEIDPECFYSAVALEKITIPEGVELIPERCFEFCSELKEVTMPTTLQSIADLAFKDNSKLSKIHFNNSLRSIGMHAFSDCEMIDTLNFPNSLEEIGNEAFRNCKGIKAINFGTGLKRIGELAFFHNHGVEKLSFPDDIVTIDYGAFAECSGLKEIILGKAQPELVQNPFLGCLALEKVTVSDENNKYAAEDGVLYSKDFTKLYCYPNARANTKLVTNDALVKVQDLAFWFCANLKEIEFSPNFTTMGMRPFWGCENISRITVKTAIPAVTDFGDSPFEGEGAPLWTGKCQLLVPAGSKPNYQASLEWKTFQINETSGVQNITTDSGVKVSVENGICTIENIPAGYNLAQLIDMSGRTVGRTIISGSTTATLNANGISRGIHVLVLQGAAGTHSIKVQL